jgi:putative oxidoreductase
VKARLLLAARLATAGVFLAAALAKLPDMAAFAVDMANYRVLPPPLVPWAASTLVGVEILAGLALLAGIWSRAAALLASALLGLFVLGVAQAMLRGIDLACGCFGGDARATWMTVLRDVGLLLPALAVAAFGGGGWRAGD